MQQQCLSETGVEKPSTGYTVSDERSFKEDHDVGLSAAVSVDVNSDAS